MKIKSNYTLEDDCSLNNYNSTYMVGPRDKYLALRKNRTKKQNQDASHGFNKVS